MVGLHFAASPGSDEEVDVDEPAPGTSLQPQPLPTGDDGSGTDTDDDGELIRKVGCNSSMALQAQHCLSSMAV
jgi:hypothetical protein